ncbi:mitotic checkpoint serine/threonine-protein kinase BUB1 isoform X1 [Amborella trichopoda]|uniref:mitotic checkpoint serine/threonine-protein kinase BUB1 isoform X1 n=1 Tax=Amborella trichopoda TaxID=13333 RepID=UPI0009C0FEC4|nr:mitotic checkpoint serine/threonine-protein kinase BUB1 isoform X1 [Amborella trichopoda]|eukprot:XP_020525970.1 mitotic checkpoint serine/threonine-protein kinase BUB1 isoform X1 [Amborella trichopoda]
MIPSPHYNADDPLFPSLCKIKGALGDFSRDRKSSSGPLLELLEDCTKSFETEDRYRTDPRFLKVWILYADISEKFEEVFKEMEEKKIGLTHSLLYEAYAVYLEAKGKPSEADAIYELGISRKAMPFESLKKAYTSFLCRMAEVTQFSGLDKAKTDACIEREKIKSMNPWSDYTINSLLEKLNPFIKKYNGYFRSAKKYLGKMPLSSLRTSRNTILELDESSIKTAFFFCVGSNIMRGKKIPQEMSPDMNTEESMQIYQIQLSVDSHWKSCGCKYQIKGCAGRGGFAEVYKAYKSELPEDVVALKIQKPAFPWEFYLYRQLDKRIPSKERSAFGFAQRVHIFSDCSILVCDYVAHGLQDVINSYLVTGQHMDEILCMYYTTEMLRMLETLHTAGIIHGDFKSDNLLVRYASGDPQEDAFLSRSGPWEDQGLCLIDWGRGIDLSLFPVDIEFHADCRTSNFRCIEMQENRPWKFQVDIYGLCVVVHMMLHGQYMELEKKIGADGSVLYQPKSYLKRYWNIDLWQNMFTTLLNCQGNYSPMILQGLRKSFEDYMCKQPHLIKKLMQLLVRQRTCLCSGK